MANAVILNDLIEHLDITVAKFERAIGVGASTISKALVRNSQIKLDLVDKIATRYPQVNRDWLLTGEGEMILKEPRVSSELGDVKDNIIEALKGNIKVMEKTIKMQDELIDIYKSENERLKAEIERLKAI